jgi:ribonuclease HI
MAKEKNVDNIYIYTDGACSCNPGPGGYASIIKQGNYIKEIVGGNVRTTNNRMELLGAIVALEDLKNKNIPVVLISDSKYVVDAVNKKWLDSWIKNNFKKRLNKDLWIRFSEVYTKFPKIQFIWIKGHNGNLYNERCDKLARNYIQDNYLCIT